MKFKIITLVFFFIVLISLTNAEVFNTTWNSGLAEGWSVWSGSPLYNSFYFITSDGTTEIYKDLDLDHTKEIYMDFTMMLDYSGGGVGRYGMIAFTNATSGLWYEQKLGIQYNQQSDSIIIYSKGVVLTTCSNTPWISTDGTWYNITVRINTTGFVNTTVFGIDECLGQLPTPFAEDIDNLMLHSYHHSVGYRNAFDDVAYIKEDDIPPVIVPTNTSIRVAKFNYSSFTFATDTFFNAMEFEFNTSETVNLSLITSFNTEKLSISGTENIISGRIYVDDVLQITENLRTVSDVNEIGSTGFYPINFQVASGIHNITIQLKRSLPAQIEISNIDIILIEFNSNDSNEIKTQLTTTEFSHTSTDYARTFNWTFGTRNTSLFILNKQTVTSTGASNTSYLFLHIDDLDNSTATARYLSSSNDIGSISNLWISSTGTQENFSILSKTNAETITINTTILSFELRDSANSTIQGFSLTNSSSEIDSRLSLESGTHKLIETERLLHTGDGFFLGGSLSFRSLSETQTPKFIINSTNSSIDCYTEKERYLEDSSDIGNAYLYTTCTNLTVNNSYSFSLYAVVSSGETLELIDETLTGFEITKLSVSEIAPNLTMTIETDLVNNTKNYKNDTLLTYYNFTTGLDNSVNIANCSFELDGIIKEIQVDRNSTTNYLFNISVIDTAIINATTRIYCNNTEISATTGTYFYSIDTINPLLESTQVNSSLNAVGDTLSYSYNCSDSSIFATNETIKDVDSTIVFNRFQENLTGTFIENSTSYLFAKSGNHTVLLECWDSHSAKRVSPINWEIKNNASLVIAQDLEIWDSNLKYYNRNGDLITFLALAENEESYKIKFTWKTTSKEHTLKINSSSSLIPVLNRRWRGHFIYDYKRGIDIEGNNVKTVNITKQTGYYLLKIELFNASDELETNSIFDLNYVTLKYKHIVLSEVGISNLLLNDINNTLANLNLIAEENRGSNMNLWLIFFVILFFAIGIIVRQPLYWNLSGIGLLLIGLVAVQQSQTNETLLNFGLSIVFITLGFLIMLLSTFLYLKNRIAQSNKSISEFYDI